MAEVDGKDATRSTWELRAAGSQENSSPELWAPHARVEGLDLSGLLRRRKLLLLAVFACVFIPAAAWNLTAKPTYQAWTVLSVKAQPSDGAPVRALEPLEMVAELDKLRGFELMRVTAERLGLGDRFQDGDEDSGLDEAARALQLAVKAGRERDAQIAIHYADEDPELAAAVANTVAQLYVEASAGAEASETKALTVAVVWPATPPTKPMGASPWGLLLAIALAAGFAALAAAAVYDRRRRPVARIADIVKTAGAPVLRMTEEIESHVS